MNIDRTQGRGIVLITTLAILTFLVMLSTMLVTTGYNALRRAGTFEESEQAHEASLAGIAYAQMRAEADMAWMTYDPSTHRWRTGPGGTVSGITVTESISGIITGDIKATSTGQRSRFVISFNDQSRATAYTSCNNLTFDTPDDTQFNGAHFRTVPPHTLNLIVEGQALDQSGVVVRASRLAEISLSRDLTTLVDGVAYSGNDMNISVDTTGGAWSVGSVDDSGDIQVGIRPLGNVQLYSPDFPAISAYDFDECTIHFTDDGSGNQNRAFLRDFNHPDGSALNYTPASADTIGRQASATKVAQVELKPTDMYNGTYPATIREGTYIVQSDGSLTYFPFSFDPTKTISFDGRDSGNGNKFKVTYDGNAYYGDEGASVPNRGYFNSGRGGWTMNITQPTRVVDSAGHDAAQNLAFISADPLHNASTLKFTTAARSTQPALLKTASVDITVGGDVTGTGSVISGGNLTMEGHSLLKPAPNTGLTLYAAGDVTLKPVTQGQSDVSTADIEDATRAVLMGAAGTTNAASISVKDFSKQAATEGLKTLATVSPGYTDKPSNYAAYVGAHPNATIEDYVKAQMNFTYDKDYQVFAANVLQNYSSPGAPGTGALVSTAFNSSKTPTDHDEVFYGMVYACGNFNANPGSGNNLTVQGAVVAYGNDPNKTFNATDRTTYAGANGKGKINMSGKSVNFTYDPAYLGAISRLFSATYTRTKRNFFLVY